MMVHLVLLASSTARNKGIDKGGQTGPPEITFDNGLGMKMPCIPGGGGFVQRANKGAVGCWWYIHLFFKVEAAVLKGPVSKGIEGNHPAWLESLLEQGGQKRKRI